MGALGEASAASGALFCGIAHFGKQIETGTKGSSSFEDDADTVLALIGTRNVAGTISNSRMTARKNRAGESGQEFRFETRKVEVGSSFPVTTLVVEWSARSGNSEEGTEERAADQKTKFNWRKSRGLLQLWESIMAIPEDQRRAITLWPGARPVEAWAIKQVRATFYRAYHESDIKHDTKKKAFKRAIDAAVLGRELTTPPVSQWPRAANFL
jgi:hypothetical protein